MIKNSAKKGCRCLNWWNFLVLSNIYSDTFGDGIKAIFFNLKSHEQSLHTYLSLVRVRSSSEEIPATWTNINFSTFSNKEDFELTGILWTPNWRTSSSRNDGNNFLKVSFCFEKIFCEWGHEKLKSNTEDGRDSYGINFWRNVQDAEIDKFYINFSYATYWLLMEHWRCHINKFGQFNWPYASLWG